MAFLKNGVDISTLFDPRITTAQTSMFVDGVDIGNQFERVQNGTNIASNTGFVYGGNGDLRYVYAALGSTAGSDIYDINTTYVRRNIVWTWDSKAGSYVVWSDSFTIRWANVQIATGQQPISVAGYRTNFSTWGGYSYSAYTYNMLDYSGSQAAGEEIYYYPVKRTVASPTINSFTAGSLNMTVGYSNSLFPNFSGGTGVISPTVGTVLMGYNYTHGGWHRVSVPHDQRVCGTNG